VIRLNIVMHIVKAFTTPSGATALVHRLHSFTGFGDAITAVVNSYADGSTMILWQDSHPLSASDLSNCPASIFDALVSPTGPFAGGILQDDPLPLDEAKAKATARLETIRDARLAGGCPTPFGPIDTDMISRQNISGAVSMASIAKAAAQPFELRWRFQDNTYVDLDADQMITVGVIVGTYISNVYNTSFTIKDAINAAQTIAELEAIDLEAA
jgi:hypothetical protein